MEEFYLLDLFNNDDNTSDYIVPGEEMIKEESSENDMEENDLDLIRGVLTHSAWRNLRITSAW